ncbi:hypothetical protein Hanom_Chr03g00185611 [Helianthus anomalus]
MVVVLSIHQLILQSDPKDDETVEMKKLRDLGVFKLEDEIVEFLTYEVVKSVKHRLWVIISRNNDL